MTCGPEPTRYRILGPHSHWTHDLAVDPALPNNAAEIGDVIRLRRTPGELDELVDAHFLPPYLGRGCGPCDWFLVIDPATCPRGGLFRLVDGRWCELRPGGCALALERPLAIATAGERIAVLDAGRGEILVFARGARRIALAIAFSGEGPIALDGRGRVYAADGTRMVAFASDGRELRRADLPDPVSRLAPGDHGALWIVTRGARIRLWRWDAGAAAPAELTGDLADALAALPATHVTLHGDVFCIALPRGGDAPVTRCFDRCGRPAEPPEPPAATTRSGLVATIRLQPAPTVAPIDSGRPRCRWHRVRLDADIPDGTAIAVEVAATELDTDVPHAADWQRVPAAGAASGGQAASRAAVVTDFLIDQPAGRYLHLRIRLDSHVARSPVIRSIRLDFPRSTSVEWLPAVYRDEPESSRFVEQFLAIFDATLEDLDRAIARFPALLDPRRAPESVLAWLASLVGATLDGSLALHRRRALLEKLPELYRRRGTPEGLRLAIEALTGVSPAIEELNAPSPFGALASARAHRVPGGARIGEVRLFGRGRARVRLGASTLGATQLRSHGDPDDDARSALAFRVRILLPAAAGIDGARLERLVAAQLPAHVVATVRTGERQAAVATATAVGIDTLLTGLPRPILGRAGNVRLRRRSALWPSGGRGDAAIAVGAGAAVGMQTILR